jgi:hypothetical protein
MIGPYKTTSGVTYFNPESIASIVYDAANDNTHVHICSGTIFTMKQTQSEFTMLRKRIQNVSE